MMKLPVLLSIGLVSTIVSGEILGLANLVSDPVTAVATPTKRPYRRASGAKRGVCRTTPAEPLEELMAFLPESKNGADLTATKAPTFYFYVPDRPENVASLEFRLDYAAGPKRGNGVLNPPLQVPIANTPGVVKVQLPEVLEKDTTYAWSFTLRCQATRETVSFKGTIVYQDLDATVAAQLAKANTVQQKAAIYTQIGFMLDAVPILLGETQLQGKSFAAIIAETGLEKPIDVPKKTTQE
jgi:Domain of Unknown Function (DUF928)